MIKNVNGIKGLTMYENIFSDLTANKVVEDLESREWDDRIRRRTQHYNYRYPYNRSKRLINANSLNKEELKSYKGLYRMSDSTTISRINNYLGTKLKIASDQCIVNKYDIDDKIAKHKDDETLFGEKIASLSLLAPTLMTFQNIYSNDEIHEIVLPPKSLIVMEGEARHSYTHEITKRKTFKYNGLTYRKPDNYLRISITFRKVKN